MKNIFKIAIVAIALTITTTTVTAQEKGDMAVGIKVAYNLPDLLSTYGFGAKFQYNILDPLRLDGSFTYFLPNEFSATSRWDFSINAQWLFPGGEKMNYYPLAGFGILGTKQSVESDSLFIEDLGGNNTSASTFGVNLGGGIDYLISESFLLNLEAKYMLISGGGRIIFSAGAAYRF
jgi:outer membrane protein X